MSHAEPQSAESVRTTSRCVLFLTAVLGMLSVPCGADTPVPLQALQNSPRIACDKPEYNFGEVEDRFVIKHTFVVRNLGNAVLEIRKVYPGCGCTVTKLNTTTIKPGGKAELKAQMTLRGRRGLQQKTIRIESNDPVNPRFPLRLKGTVYTMAYLEPSFVVFSNVLPDKPTEKEIRLVSRKSGVNLSEIRTHSPKIRAELRKEPDGRCVRIVVCTVPPLPAERISDSITVKTDDPELDVLNLPVTGNVVGEVTVLPRQIVLRQSTGIGVKRAIFIRAGSVANFQILDVQAPIDASHVSIHKQENGMVRIELSELTASPELNGKTVRILTDLEHMRTIEIPIKILP